MRVPGTKVYRAFPELDAFSDADCERYVSLARARVSASYLLMVVANWLLYFLLVALGLYLATRVYSTRPAVFNHLFAGRFWLSVLLTATLLLGSAGVCLWRRDRWLRRAIKKRVTEARCAGCQYTLLGLKVTDGAVLCPECGLVTSLAQRGLTPADLLAPAATPDTPAA